VLSTLTTTFPPILFFTSPAHRLSNVVQLDDTTCDTAEVLTLEVRYAFFILTIIADISVPEEGNAPDEYTLAILESNLANETQFHQLINNFPDQKFTSYTLFAATLKSHIIIPGIGTI
jgi:hypothetical protein